MNGGQGAVQACTLAQFFERQIGFVRQQASQVVLMGGDEERLAARETMARGNVAGATALLQEFLDHAQGDSIAAGDLLPSALVVVVSRQNPFPQIQG